MDFQTTIKEIVNSIKQREFLNEAEVTNGIVMRILNELHWNVYDTKRVKPQLGIEGKKIDMALCYPDNKPTIIIEVKALGKAVNADEQVLTYSFKLGIPVAVLTDGQEWHFYLPAERGTLTERRFYKLDLLEREPSEIVDILSGYLDYEAIKNGSAFKKAKTDYDKQYKNKEIIASIPTAWEKLLQDKDTTLVTLIAEKVADLCGYEPSEDTIINYLQGLNKNHVVTNDNYKEPTKIIEPTTSRNRTPENFNRGVILNNTVYANTRNSIGTLEALLKLAITQFPNAMSKIETQTTGRSRCLISKQKERLYDDRPDLLEKCSRQLPNNWWMGTNYSGQSMTKFCDIIETAINREYGNQNIKWKL